MNTNGSVRRIACLDICQQMNSYPLKVQYLKVRHRKNWSVQFWHVPPISDQEMCSLPLNHPRCSRPTAAPVQLILSQVFMHPAWGQLEQLKKTERRKSMKIP